MSDEPQVNVDVAATEVSENDAPVVDEMLPEEMLDRKILVPKSGGEVPMTIAEARDYARNAYQAAARTAEINATLKAEIANRNNQPPPEPEPVVQPPESYLGEDPFEQKVISAYGELTDTVREVQQKLTAREQAEQQAQQQAQAQQAQQRMQSALQRVVEGEFKDKIMDQDDVILVYRNAIEIRNQAMQEGDPQYNNNDEGLFRAACNKVVKRQEAKVQGKLMDIRNGLDGNAAATVQGPGGEAPLPVDPNKKITTDPEERKQELQRKYAHREQINRTKGAGLGG